MKKFLLSLFAIPILTSTQPVEADTFTASVTEVHDGDTIAISTCNNMRLKVRLLGVDAPELKQEYGTIARDYLKSLVLGKEIKVVTDRQMFDLYGRVLGYVYVEGQFVNLQMLNIGLAVFEEVKPNVTHSMSFSTGEQFARTNLKGFWKTGGLKQRPKDFRHKKDVIEVVPTSVETPNLNNTL